MKEKGPLEIMGKLFGGQVSYQPMTCARTALVNLCFTAVDKKQLFTCTAVC